MTNVERLFSVTDLHAHYGKSHILHGVNFHIESGEVLSLLGRNGSGRSTTLKSIMGLVTPTSGQIKLKGRNLAGQRPYTVSRAGIAYVPEEREVLQISPSKKTCEWVNRTVPVMQRAGPLSRCSTIFLASRSAAIPRPAAFQEVSSRC